jgi:hypothetical protein
MAEIICPVCGESNSPEAKFCRSCHSPLPENLAPLQPGQAPVPIDTGELEPILPQWLRDVRDQARQATPQEPPSSPPSQTPPPAEPTDLLAGLQSQAAEEDEEIPDWLRTLAGEESQPAASQPEEKPGAPSQAGFPPPAASPLSSPAEESPAPADLPPWLSALTPAQESSPQRDEFAEWFAQASAGEAAGSPQPPTGPATEPPVSAGEEATVEPPLDLDWLHSLDSAEKERADSVSRAEAPGGEESDLPDWLKSLPSAAPGGEAETPPPEEEHPLWRQEPGHEETPPALEESALPDWLQGLSTESAAAQTPPAEEIPPALEESALPDWLQGLSTEPAAAQTPPAEEIPPALEESALPDWLQGLSTEPAAAQTPPAEEIPPALEESALPDWLQGLSTEPAAPPISTAEEETPPPAAPAFVAPPTIPASELHVEPEWLASLRAGENEAPAEEIAPPSTAEEARPAFTEAPLSAEGIEEIFASDLPDWLLSAAETPSAGESQLPPESEDSLAPAELPSWLQAMRPIEATLEEGAEIGAAETQEEQGPLAGLRGVLPVPVSAISLPKPRPVSLKLQVSEEQQSHMALLDQILAAETTPRPIQSAKTVRSFRLLRWLIAALFIALTALIFFTGSRFFATPAFQPSVFAARDAIAALPEGAPVLVALEYQPALSGELEAVAAPFVDALMILRHPRLIFVSTSPLGADLAERFLSRTQLQHGYQRREQYLNLGYLPGGESGVRAFVQNPSQAAPFAVDLAPAWQSSPLQGVQAFSDFSAVLVITDSVESGRMWIEQSQPVRGSAPLLLITSAQAGPLLQPYYQSGQVTGLLSGLYDGAVMERNNADRPGVARRYWDAYSLGLWLAILMIVIGAAWNFVLGWRERSDAVEME